MIPKEHGAWNALLISLFSGWIALGEWNPAALAAGSFWVCAFILRAPLATARQYRNVDWDRTRQCVTWALNLGITAALALGIFLSTAPAGAKDLFLWAGLPLSALLGVLSLLRPNLRSLGAEILGFAWVSLLVPVLYLCSGASSMRGAAWLFILFAGYFLCAVDYVKLRQGWLALSRLKGEAGFGAGWRPLLFHGLFLGLALFFSPNPWLALGPAYAILRVLAGIRWGRRDLPIMRLGLQEMAHSLVFMVLSLSAFKAF